MTQPPYLPPSPELDQLRATYTKNGAELPPYLKPDFQQGLELDRHPKLLMDPKRVKWEGSLHYQYEDGETVTVPNVWYTQPPWMRADHERWQAEEDELRAMRFKTRPPLDLKPDAVQRRIKFYQLRAKTYRNRAEILDAAGDNWFPELPPLPVLLF